MSRRSMQKQETAPRWRRKRRTKYQVKEITEKKRKRKEKRKKKKTKEESRKWPHQDQSWHKVHWAPRQTMTVGMYASLHTLMRAGKEAAQQDTLWNVRRCGLSDLFPTTHRLVRTNSIANVAAP